jgi:nicotinamide phosphoribosyltransferase
MPRPFIIPSTRTTDSYKISHWRQYPPGTQTILSYLESRGGKWAETVFFGAQYMVAAYLEGVVCTAKQLDRDEAFFAPHFFGDKSIYNRAGWDRIVKVHGGRLPLKIHAVPEGSVVGTRNVLMTFENLDPQLPWLTNYFETIGLHPWYPTTVATGSYHMKKAWYRALDRSGTPASIHFKHHDFGFRGVETVESAGIGGAAHLVNFRGTDTIAALELILQYYSGKTKAEIDDMPIEEYREFCKANMAGFSIPAGEHSTMTTWGQSHEIDAYRNMLTKFPTGFVAFPIDSWSTFGAAEMLGKELKADVEVRDGVCVSRPDSGDPHDILPQLLSILGKGFGYEMNDKHYKVLNGKIRVIQGDGIDYDTSEPILETVMDAGWSVDNLAFGSGGGLLQKVNRDTQQMAIKCCSATINGKDVDVFKRPATDPNKNSKKGRLALVRDENGRYQTVPLDQSAGYSGGNQLREIFNYGKVLNTDLFSDIVKRAELPELKAMQVNA